MTVLTAKLLQLFRDKYQNYGFLYPSTKVWCV